MLSEPVSAIDAILIGTSTSTDRVVRGFANYAVISMRGVKSMSQWKRVAVNEPTGFLDKNGVEICLGDSVTYRRKVRSSYYRPGYYKMITANVVGFGKIVKNHWRGYPVQLEYVHLKETGNFNVFRIYRSENLLIMFKSEK